MVLFDSGVIRVTRDHVPLLKRWKELLESSIYKQSQQKPYDKRDCHLYGAQDVLTALLTSREFSWVPVKLLYRGKDIIQYFGPLGYTVRERLINFLNGLPPFIHCLGFKPWRLLEEAHLEIRLRRFYVPLLLELSPYNYIASRYKSEADEPMPWLYRSSSLGSFFKILGLGNPCLTDLPISIVYNTWTFTKRLRAATGIF